MLRDSQNGLGELVEEVAEKNDEIEKTTRSTDYVEGG